MTLLIVTAGIPKAAASPAALHWCLDHFPQMHEFDGKSRLPTGPSVEMMQEIARRAGLQLQISRQTPIARCLKDLAAGDTDIMVNLLYNEERARQFILIRFASRLPDQLYRPVTAAKPVLLLSQISSMSIVIVRGFRLHPKLQKIADALPASQIQYVDSALTALKLVAMGRTEAALLSPDIVKTVLSQHPDIASQLQSTQFPHDDLQPEDIFIGLSRHLKHAVAEQKIKTALAQMKQDGSLQRILGNTVLY
jgi:polar amino acid transport system substrate-binding protein